MQRPLLSELIRHEWRLLVRDRVAVVVSLLFAVCLATSMVTGHATERRLANGVAQALQANVVNDDSLQRFINEELVRLRRDSVNLELIPFGFAHGTYSGHYQGPRRAILPVSPLASLTIGQADVSRSFVRVAVDPYYYETLRDPVHPYGPRTGRFDPAFVIIYLLPLLVLALSVSLVTAEREAGTLALLTVQRTTPARIALAKLVVRGGLLAGVLLLALLVEGILASSSAVGGAEGIGQVFARYVLWLSMALLYGAFWFAVSLAIDAHGSASVANAMRYTLVWLLLVIVIPSLASVATTTLRPVPSRATRDEAVASAKQVVWSMPSDTVIARLFRKYPDLPREPLSPKADLERFMAVQMHRLVLQDSIVAPVEHALRSARERRLAFANRLVFVSPALLIANLLSEAAGTGEGRFTDYDRQVVQFRQTWNAYFEPRIYRRTPVLDVSVTPKFTYAEEPFVVVLRRALGPALAIAVVFGLVALVAIRGYRRYPVLG